MPSGKQFQGQPRATNPKGEMASHGAAWKSDQSSISIQRGSACGEISGNQYSPDKLCVAKGILLEKHATVCQGSSGQECGEGWNLAMGQNAGM